MQMSMGCIATRWAAQKALPEKGSERNNRSLRPPSGAPSDLAHMVATQGHFPAPVSGMCSRSLQSYCARRQGHLVAFSGIRNESLGICRPITATVACHRP